MLTSITISTVLFTLALDFRLPLLPPGLHLDLRLGGGRNGSVFQGSLNKTVVAVKVLSSEASSDAFFDRVHSWRSLNHANICEVYRVSSNEDDSLYLVMQCHVNGNSRQYLTRNPNVDRGKIILETALGMQYLHSCDVIHGGLKPTNILIRDNGEACVSDWATVEIQPSRNKEAHRYFSPEAWKGTVSRPSDVFSFAMSAYELYTLSQPWGVLSEKQIYQLVVAEDARPDRPDPTRDARVGLNNYFWDVIEECWRKEPRMRPSFDIVVRLWRSYGTDTPQEVSAFNAKAMPAAVIASLAAEFGQLSTRSTSLGRSSTVASTRSFKSGPPAYEKPLTASPTSPLSPLSNYTPLSSQIFSPTLSSSTDASSLSTPRSHPVDDLPPISPVSNPLRVNSLSNSSDYSRHWDPTSTLARSYTPQLSAFAEVDEHIVRSESPSLWETKRRGIGAITHQPIATAWDRRSGLSAESEGLSGTGSSSSLSRMCLPTPNDAYC
ncbi:kinase-like protein [Guyanagaster necrorhizus]|uniref:Kinase-like protein n=1 Tax=Guyanagaster necrorhizus TaxID=856835 RepID=A0A9P7VIV8_9AGAR|nr:kinase-like protein [Guyanagaster necrorhizus MCA 3950]KAG7441504.1 kinase-like protein [Guyanagaster necrorhizus MCA 3950]